MIVLDASVVLEVVLRTPGSDALVERILGEGRALHAPHLIDVEVAHVLRRFVAGGDVAASRAREAMEVFAVFPLTRYAHTPLLPRMWELRANLTAYDAAYVALAEGLRATLVTRDKRLAAAPRIRAEIEVV